MIANPRSYWGRLLTSGPFLVLLAALLLVSVAVADNDPTLPEGLQAAMDRLAKLKAADPPDVDALQTEYLVLFENFPRHQRGKEAIFELHATLRRAGRTSEAYATLAKIQAVYQDDETMGYPGKEALRISLAATARIEEAHLFATAMNNPFQAIETIDQARARYTEKRVGVVAPDREYQGRIDIITRLELARYRLAAGQTNLASTELLSVVRDWPGEKITFDGYEQLAATAAVRLLPLVLEGMPAGLPKKARVVTTFEETAVDTEARLWLAFVRARAHFDHFRRWQAKGAFSEGAQALRGIIDQHRDVVLADQDGATPAGLLAMRELRDAELNILKNTTQAGQTLEAYYARFSKDKKERLFAGYALLFLAETDLDFRNNAASAFTLFMQVAEQYGDLPVYPPRTDGETSIRQHALRWAKRAQEKM